jgi:hypothetical protein
METAIGFGFLNIFFFGVAVFVSYAIICALLGTVIVATGTKPLSTPAEKYPMDPMMAAAKRVLAASSGEKELRMSRLAKFLAKKSARMARFE